MDAERFARIKACHDTGGKVSEEAAGELIAEVEHLRDGLDVIARGIEGVKDNIAYGWAVGMARATLDGSKKPATT